VLEALTRLKHGLPEAFIGLAHEVLVARVSLAAFSIGQLPIGLGLPVISLGLSAISLGLSAISLGLSALGLRFDPHLSQFFEDAPEYGIDVRAV